MRAFVALVSPDWAKKMLGLSKFNRNINRNYVEKLKLDLINGRWELTGESIIVVGDYEDLSDGHHRLTAIAETGISALSVVVIGVQRSTKVDIGRNRSVRDQAVMSGVVD